MDLSRHARFLDRSEPVSAEAIGQAEPPLALGPALLFSAWSALGSAGVEAVDLHLRSGLVIRSVVRVRMVGPLAQASTRREGWTHLFPAEDLILVRLVGRGGNRS